MRRTRFFAAVLIFLVAVCLLEGSSEAESDRARMRSNLDVWFSSHYTGKKAACLGMADALLDAGYEPAFAAGVVANVACEGVFGQFENIWNYTPQRLLQVYPGLSSPGHGHNYIAHMRSFSQYDSCGHDHSEYADFSGKLVYNGISLTALGELVERYRDEGWKARFGLGSVQWTGERAALLVKFYQEEAGSGDEITFAQCVRAEQRCMLYELANTRTTAVTAWKTRHAQEPNTPVSAYDAGYYVCYYYETPGSYQTVSVTRGELAKTIYQAMIEGTSYEKGDTTPPVVRGAQIRNVSGFGYEVEVTAEDDSGIVAVELTAWNRRTGRGSALQQVQSFENETPVVAHFYVARSDVPGAPDGEYCTEIIATDRSGNGSAVFAAEDVVIDSRSPVIRNIQVINQTRDGFDLVVEAEDETGIGGMMSAVWTDWEEASGAVWQRVDVGGGVLATVVFHVDVKDHGEARDVLYHAGVFAFDQCGNISEGNNTTEVWVDGTPPWVTEVSITGTDDEGFSITAHAEDQGDGVWFRFTSWSTWKGQDDRRTVEVEGVQGEATVQVRIADHGGEFGRYCVQVTAGDAAGNWSEVPVLAETTVRDATAYPVILRELDRAFAFGNTYRLMEVVVMNGAGMTRSPTWTEAGEVCASLGGNLPVIRTQEENARIQEVVVRAGSPCWIGATDEKNEGIFLWQDGEPLTYSHWASGQPDDAMGDPDVGHSEDYAVMLPEGTWADVHIEPGTCERILVMCQTEGTDLSGMCVMWMPTGLTEIGEEAFMGTDCEAVVIPATCTRIASRAFSGCKELRFVFLPPGLEDVAPDAFAPGVQLIREIPDKR